MYKEHPLVFTDKITEDNLNSLDSSFVFYLMYDKTQTIRSQDIDHIHPKSKLEEYGYGEDLINNIFNYQLIDSGTNRGTKNDSQLKKWIEDHIEDKDTYLKKHLIPADNSLWIEDNFEAFLKERAKLLMDKIHSNGI